MTKEELAAAITGSEYPFTLPKDLKRAARAADLVVIYGASDDLMECEGAIDHELGAGEETAILLTPVGLFNEQACAEQCCFFLEAKALAEKRGGVVTAHWDTDGYSWTYTTAIPHATFEIVEEGLPYCRGIVFALSDVAPAADSGLPECP